MSITKACDPLTLIIGSHNHVPYGLGDDELELFYSKKLKPFITVLNKFPKIQAVLYHSGFLLQWLDKAHSEYLSLVENLVARKQVELLGGAFYEPLLTLLPLTDKLGQIELMTTYIRKEFGKRPQGCWLPALAWDQSLTGILHNSGIGYTFLREEQFIRAGLTGEALYTPHITEDQGKLITVFPISSRLTGNFTAGKLARTVEQLAGEIPPGGRRVISAFPEQWFQRSGGIQEIEDGLFCLFEELSRCASFADFNTPIKLYKSRQGLTKAYFPDSFEGEPAEDSSGENGMPQIDASSRQLLITYPEANRIYAKMMFIHVLINQLRGDKARKRNARESLWKAQGLDSFYRRPEGGIYRNTVRHAAYRALLGAEKITREKGVFIPSLMTLDFDLDGEDEYLFQDEYINCYIKTLGAGIFEFDYLPKTWNYLATMENQEKSAASRRLRTGFADFLTPPGFPPEALAADRQPGGFPGRCCALERYEVCGVDKAHKKACFRLPPNEALPLGSVEIEKTYRLTQDALSVMYLLTNRGGKELTFNFVPRLDLAFPGGGENYQRVLKPGGEVKNALPGAEGTIADTAGVELRDLKNEVSITLESNRNFTVHIHPTRVSCPVHGKNVSLYQSTCVLPVSPVVLKGKASWTAEYQMKLLSL
ncbi:MAG: DUF1926 domain-containing protein [Spirochaetaceae bacterium]|jgi:hypothetical protein|nr:DUF1926 domain-containing protein [Spirochaetaceae bacterium]